MNQDSGLGKTSKMANWKLKNQTAVVNELEAIYNEFEFNFNYK